MTIGQGADLHGTNNKNTSARPEGLVRKAARWTGPILLVAAMVFLAGFGLFAERISNIETPSDISPAQAIVVLTGGQFRIEAAFALLANQKAQKLLISGVNPDASETALSRATGLDKNLFACCVDVGYEAKDTVGNAMETVLWLRRNGYKSLILVTNNYHMPRSVLELRRIDPTLDIRPYSVVNTDLTGGKWMNKADTVRVLLGEYIKYLGAKMRAVLPVPASLSSLY